MLGLGRMRQAGRFRGNMTCCCFFFCFFVGLVVLIPFLHKVSTLAGSLEQRAQSNPFPIFPRGHPYQGSYALFGGNQDKQEG